jgi:hypothetical protein
MTEPNQAGVRSDQDRRRAALIERIGKVVYLCADTPLQGDLGDAAYELLIQASAQIASDRKRLSALTSAGDGTEVASAASMALMYLETGFVECPQCGHEVPTNTLDAVCELRGAGVAPAAFDGGK